MFLSVVTSNIKVEKYLPELIKPDVSIAEWIIMRKKNKIVLWPVYFDATKTNKGGRRIPKKFAISSPKIEELQRVAIRLDLQPEVIFEAVHPSYPWRKSGLIIIPKKESKSTVMKKMGKELFNLRK